MYASAHLTAAATDELSISDGDHVDECGRDAPSTCGTTPLTYSSPPLTTNFGMIDSPISYMARVIHDVHDAPCDRSDLCTCCLILILMYMLVGSLIGDDENSLKANPRGPTLLEDNILREKITHFDHERIPERVVHARGSTAHGYFENYKSLAHLTKADLFQRAGQRTHTFVRFSTVAGGAGSVDLPRGTLPLPVTRYHYAYAVRCRLYILNHDI